jgi:hypothetical protein
MIPQIGCSALSPIGEVSPIQAKLARRVMLRLL